MSSTIEDISGLHSDNKRAKTIANMPLWKKESITFLLDLAPRRLSGELTDDAIADLFIEKVNKDELEPDGPILSTYNTLGVGSQYRIIARTPEYADEWRKAVIEGERLKEVRRIQEEEERMRSKTERTWVAMKTDKMTGTVKSTNKNAQVGMRRNRRTQPYPQLNPAPQDIPRPSGASNTPANARAGIRRRRRIQPCPTPSSQPQATSESSKVPSLQSRDGGEAEMKGLATEVNELNMMGTSRDPRQKHVQEQRRFSTGHSPHPAAAPTTLAHMASSTERKRLPDEPTRSDAPATAGPLPSPTNQHGPRGRGRESQQQLPPTRQGELGPNSIPAYSDPFPTPANPQSPPGYQYPYMTPPETTRRVSLPQSVHLPIQHPQT